MGFFDDILKHVDKGIKAVESGALEEKLNKFADVVDKSSKQAEAAVKKVSDRPAELLKTAENHKDVLEAKAKNVQAHVKKNIDVLQGKD